MMSQRQSSGGPGLGVKLSARNRAVLYPSVCNGAPQAPVENRATTGGQREPSIHEIALLSNDFNSVTCQLISECHSIFAALQEVGTGTSSSRSSSLLHISRQYRAVLHACLLSARTSSDYDNGHSEELPAISFGDMELIWHLCEIIFLEVLPVGCVMQPLLEWVRWHCSIDDRVRHLISQPDPTEHDDFWNTVNLLVLQGRVDTARDLLTQLSSRRINSAAAFGSMEELLRKMPEPKSLFGQSLSEFSLRWKRWQQECRNRCMDGEFSSVPQLQHIAQMLIGDSTALQACRPLCQNWFEVMVGTLLYTNPTVKAVDLQYGLNSFLDEGVGMSDDPVNEILKSVFEYDITAVIKQCSNEQFAPLNYWLAAHLTDLMYHCGKLETRNVDYGIDQREYLLIEFATSLMSHKSFWQMGVSYLDQCPTMGGPHLDLLIQRVPLDSERKAMKVLSVCRQRDLSEAAHTICRVMAMQALRHNRLGSALNWCLKSKDSSFAAYLADQLLSQYSSDGVFEHLDLIDNLGPAMLLNNRLTFLAQYQQFHRLYSSQEFQQAGTLLFSLLDSRLAPKELWPTILLDALPLLEMDEVIFSSEQTYELMYCLEEVHNANGSSSSNGGRNSAAASSSSGGSAEPRLNGMPNGARSHGEVDMDTTGALGRKQLPISHLMDKLSLLRLALARNLARSIISTAPS